MKCITTIYHSSDYQIGDIVVHVDRTGQRLAVVEDLVESRYGGDLYYYIKFSNGRKAFVDPADIVPVENGDLQNLAAMLALKEVIECGTKPLRRKGMI